MNNEGEKNTIQNTQTVDSSPVSDTRVSVVESLKWAGATGAPVALISLIGHSPAGLLVAGALGFVAFRHGQQGLEAIHEKVEFPGFLDRKLTEMKQNKRTGRTPLQRALGQFPKGYFEEKERPAEESNEGMESTGKEPAHVSDTEPTKEPDIFAPVFLRSNEPDIRRITVEEALQHTHRNEYRIYVGRSLTQPGNPAVAWDFERQHLKVIGASQKGKSSLAAAIMSCITESHDPRHVQIALLDLEHQTSRLFEDLPHVHKIRKNGDIIKLHAKNKAEVLTHLGHINDVIEHRYILAEENMQMVEQMPLLIVYLEEFVDLKDHFKMQASSAEADKKEQAVREYQQFIYWVKKIAARGLKVKVQLLMVAQVNYREDDLQAALVNVTSGLSFCVLPTAAKAAGFYSYDALTKNADRNRVGEAVMQTPDVRDTVLTLDYNLRAKLLALAPHQESEIPFSDISSPVPQETGYHAVPPLPPKVQPLEKPSLINQRLLDQALLAWDQGHTTQAAMAMALGKTKWTVRDVWTMVDQMKRSEEAEQEEVEAF